MSNYSTFDELKQNCREFVSAAQKRGVYNGIKNLLTELYPDKAHFIYELLQNAEDMWASKVMFTLTNDTLIFEHNGKKRDFTLDDISSITSIGDSNKRREDLSEIGQFGVGFKAVYAYTTTPEIHSGEYNFKIVDMLLPEDIGVQKCSRKGVTQFIFPLGNETKDTKTAVSEIEKGLIELDGNAITFLTHIKKIIFKLPDNSIGSIISETDEKKVQTISVYHPGNATPDKIYFLKFDKEVPVIIKGKKENRSVSIAYRMIKYDMQSFKFDPSLQGKVFIYFPAEKETHNLRFNINAPFASTVARDSVRDCPENWDLINKISDLVCESVDWIKDNGYWDRSIYSVLPHSRDINIQDRLLEKLQSKVIEKFSTSNLMQIDKDLFVYPKECVQLGRNIAKLFSNEEFKQLDGRNFIYAAQPYVSTLPITNEIHFFNDLSIAIIRENDFIELIKKNSHKIELLVKSKNIEWLCNFFAILYDILQNYQYNFEKIFETKIILAENGQFYCANEKIYIKSDYEPENIESPIYVNRLLTKNEKAHKLLEDILKIPEMSSKEDNLEKITSGDIDKIVSGMRGILDDFKKTERQAFINKYYNEPIFLAKHSCLKELITAKASECCWTSEIAPFYEKYERIPVDTHYGKEYEWKRCCKIIAKEKYRQVFNVDEVKILRDVFCSLGGNIAPKIIPCDVEKNPLCEAWVKAHKFRRTKIRCKDFTITGLDNLNGIISNNKRETVLCLWNFIASLDDDEANKYLIGYFYPSENGDHWFGDSTAVYYLKTKKWIPNKNDVYCRPCELTKDDLPHEFKFTTLNTFLKAIEFGNKNLRKTETVTNIREVAPNASDRQCELAAMVLEYPELASELTKYLAQKSSEGKSRFGLIEAAKMQNKQQAHIQGEDISQENKSVKYPTKRQEKQEQIFKEGLKTPFIRTRAIHYTYIVANREEKEYVYSQYLGKCQICGALPITKYNGRPYFAAVNIIRSDDLDDKILTNLGYGWNTLSLCPTCAAKYLYCAKNIDTMIEQIQQTNVLSNDAQDIKLTIELMGVKTTIKFTARHFIALKAAFNAYSNT